MADEQNKLDSGTDKTETIPNILETLNQDINCMEEVVIGVEQGTTFPTRIGTSVCNALIDTSATRSCISEKYYQSLSLTKIQFVQNISIRSATGSNLTPIGLVNCSFELGIVKFNSDFIVCKNLTRPLILGRDFLIQNHVTVQYADDGKCILDYQQQELVASINIENKPQLSLANSMTLPGRSLIVVCVCNNLEPDQSGQIYEIEPSQYLKEEYPNLCVIPRIHNADVYKTENVPLVVINLSTDDVYLSKGEIMGFMQNQSLDISEIVTETSTEPSPIILEDDNKEVLQKLNGEVNTENTEKRFITSPADIEVHRKVELQDVDITETQRNAFKDLCTEFSNIFSTDSSDIRKTPLLEVEIDTGDSLPITQKPYTLPLKHTTWVQRGLEILKKAGVIVRSVSPWASPVVMVPKRIDPGEPPKRRLCVDY